MVTRIFLHNFTVLISICLSYRDIAKALEDKSNVHMEDQVVNEFRQRVLSGDFSNLQAQITQMKVSENHAQMIEYHIYEQLYLELIEKG